MAFWKGLCLIPAIVVVIACLELLKRDDHARTIHRVLIGAGPGDPELLTLKAVKALARADVVLVDDLVNPEILQHCPHARIVRVGKREAAAPRRRTSFSA